MVRTWGLGFRLSGLDSSDLHSWGGGGVSVGMCSRGLED